MASGWMNRGKYLALGMVFRNTTEPTNYYLFLVTSATTPTADHNTKSELTEIATGNGYTAGGISINRDATDFDVYTEDDGNDRALVQLKNMVWTASGGSLPSSGNGARYAILSDDNATLGSRELIAYFDLVSDRTISDTQTLTLIDCELRLTE